MINHHIITLYYQPTDSAKTFYESLSDQDIHFINAGSLADSEDPWVKEHVEFEEDFHDNVCHLNSHFCELTTIYCAWKNLSPSWNDDDVVQHSHYRKFILSQYKQGTVQTPKPYPMVFLNPASKRVERTSIEGGMKICHPLPSWEAMEKVLKDMGDWRTCYNFDRWKVLASMPHPINIWRMPVRTFKEYCEWLFPRAFAIDKLIPYDNEEYMTAYQRRALSFIGERLLSYWVWAKHEDGEIEVEDADWTLLDNSKPITDLEERRMKI